MLKPRSCFLWMLMLLASHVVRAQTNNESDNFSFTLSECIEYAIKNNLSVRQSQWNVVSNEIALQQAKLNVLPSINANTNLSYSVGRTIDQYTNLYTEAPVRQQDVGISAQVTLFNGLRKLNTIKRNKNNVAVSSLDLEATQDNITLDVITAYTQILLNTELLETARIQLLTTQSQLERTRRLVEAGSLPKADLLQLDAQVAQGETAVVDAENSVALAELQLKQILQIPADRSLEVTIPEIEVPETVLLPASPGAVYSEAVATLPAIRSADLQITSAEYDISIAKADYYPSISLTGALGSNYSSVAPPQIPKAGVENEIVQRPIGFFTLPQDVGNVPAGNPFLVFTETPEAKEYTENTYLNQLEFNLRRFVQLSLNIPIFNNWQARSNVANTRIGLENARINALSQRNVVRQNIEQAYLDAKSASKSYSATQRQVTSLQEAFRNTEVRYQAGAIDAVDYNQAKNELNSAESDLVRTKYNYVFSLKVLDFYQNKPLDF